MNPAQQILLALLRLYRALLSPALSAFFGPAGGCRFTPTCSEYATEAIRTHGAGAGGLLTLRRLCRCQPWGGCGHDPVPAPSEKSSAPGTSGHPVSVPVN